MTQLYFTLCANPEYGLEPLSSIAFKVRWHQIYHLKVFMEQHGLVSPPRSETDIHYHLPGLEDGVVIYSQLRAVLDANGYIHPCSQDRSATRRFDTSIWWERFAANLLPMLLQKEV